MDCWRRDSGSQYLNLTSWQNFPCASVGYYSDITLPCCIKNDECLSNNICHFPARPDSNRSSYYVAGCTDQTLTDGAVCSMACSDQPQPDVVYNSTTGLWQCCGNDSNGNVDCNNPRGKTFEAPAPDKLSKFSVFSSSSSSQRTQSSTSSLSSATSTGAAPAAVTTVPSSDVTAKPGSSSLSVGGKAGISVGVILGVAIVVLLSMILYLVIRKLRRGDGSAQHAHNDGSEKQELHKDEEQPYAPHELSQQSHRPLEMPGQRLDGELDPSRTLHELSNTTLRS
ncbi:hypothetical protein XANCAGTX0491_002715 [Xanthoria calcicola]